MSFYKLQKVKKYLNENICYEHIKIDKTEVLINLQCTLASTLRND